MSTNKRKRHILANDNRTTENNDIFRIISKYNRIESYQIILSVSNHNRIFAYQIVSK